jgi:hypothetical protein
MVFGYLGLFSSQKNKDPTHEIVNAAGCMYYYRLHHPHQLRHLHHLYLSQKMVQLTGNENLENGDKTLPLFASVRGVRKDLNDCQPLPI